MPPRAGPAGEGAVKAASFCGLGRGARPQAQERGWVVSSATVRAITRPTGRPANARPVARADGQDRDGSSPSALTCPAGRKFVGGGQATRDGTSRLAWWPLGEPRPTRAQGQRVTPADLGFAVGHVGRTPRKVQRGHTGQAPCRHGAAAAFHDPFSRWPPAAAVARAGCSGARRDECRGTCPLPARSWHTYPPGVVLLIVRGLTRG